ncbi:MAG: hypothetical protein SGJ27_25650 [Candidatus Melainabacteria bacterium]|nr:hypothetical protein [Candidatus Melainabacteria bacterium]
MLLLNQRNRIPRLCLGELLLESGAASPTGLKDCALIAKKANAPIGRALVMTGQISELDLENALVTQRAIRTGAISERLAKQLLRSAHSHQVTIEEAYKLNEIKMESSSLSRLAKLVLAADLVNEFGMKQTLAYADKTCLPVGQSLVQLEYINESTLVNCFNLQILVRDGHLSFYDAVRALRAIEKEGRSFESLLIALGLRNEIEEETGTTPRVGELLVAAGLITHEDSLVLAELGIETDMQYGQLLSAYNLVPPHVVDAAIELQKMITAQKFTFEKAARIVAMVKATEHSLEEVLEQIESIRVAVRILQSAEASEQSKMIVEEYSEIQYSFVTDYEITIAEALLVNHVDNLEHIQHAMTILDDMGGEVSFDETISKVAEIRSNFKDSELHQHQSIQAA